VADEDTVHGAKQKAQGSPRGFLHFILGIALLVLPFFLFYALIVIWPVQVSPDELIRDRAMAEQEIAKADIVAADTILQADANNQQAKDLKAAATVTDMRAKEQQAAAEQRIRDKTSAVVTVSRSKWLDGVLGSSAEIRLLLLVVISAAIGCSIHAAKSFAAFTGRDEYDPNWNWWYFLRFPTGIGIALLTYCVIRGGFMPGTLADQSVAGTVNPFGVAGLSALVGMFSREAFDKLAELFGSIFRANDNAVAPSIEPIAPVTQATAGKSIEIKGKNFGKGLTVQIDGADRKVVSWSATSITVALNADDVAKAVDKKKLKVINPGGLATEVMFDVVPASTQPTAPTLTGVTGAKPARPTDVNAVLSIMGAGFAKGAKLVIGTSQFDTTFVDVAKLEATVPHANLSAGAKAKVENLGGASSGEVEIKLS
jgi:hypothetical protein